MKIRLITLITTMVLVIQTSILVLFMFTNYALYKSDLNKQADEQLVLIESKLSESLPVLLWNYNDGAIYNNLHAEINSEFLNAIVIKTDNIIAHKVIKNNAKGAGLELILDKLDLTEPKTLIYDGYDGKSEVGKLYLISDRTQLEEKLKSAFIVQLIQMLILDFILMVGVGILVHYFVRNPIAETKDGLKNIVDSGSVLTQKLKGHYIYEINELSEYYNDLNDYVAEIVEDQKIKSDNIEAIFNNTKNALLLLNEKGEVESANRAVKTIFKSDVEEVIKKDIALILNDPKIRYFMDPINRRESKRISLEIDLSADLTKFYISVTMTKVMLGDEKAFILVIQDVTEQNILYKEIELALEKSQESTKLKSEFLASMSHEIRTPMNGVIGMLDLMSKTSLDNQQKHYNSVARSSADSLLVIIDDILDFSKIESGKLEIEHIEFDLIKVIGEVSQTLAIKAQEKGLSVWLDTSEFCEKNVAGDPVRLRQILTNLINNATKFTHQGDILVRINPIKKTNKKIQFSCSVIDSGIGIPQEKVEHLFDSFSQVDASTTREFGGTGLGLSIVKQLCVLMGGDVEVISTLGKGSEFKFTIELNEVIDEVKSSDFNQYKDLIVNILETNSISANILEKYFSKLSIKSKLIQKHTLLDANTLDVDFIVIDENDISKKIEKTVEEILKQNPNVKVVVLSDIKELENKEQINKKGVFAQLGKPVVFEDIVACLDNHLYYEENTEVSKEPELEIENKRALKKVLLVEDNFVNQEIAIALLEENGLSVDLANHGKEALEMLRNQEDYKIVFMDCQMPEMDGYEATGAIRKGEGNNDQFNNTTIPIVAMTANAMKGDREKCISAGMDDYISKPIDEEKLSDKIKKWMS